MARLAFCFALAVAAAVFCASIARADRLVLKDGTVLDGIVIKQPDSYWIKTSDGESRIIDAADVTSYTKGDSGSSAGGGDIAATPTTNRSLAVAQAKAAVVDSPLAAVAVWQQFVDQNPDSPDLPAAKAELDKWKERATAGAQKINGKWVGGDELKTILAQSEQLTNEGYEAMDADQTLKAIDKFKEALKIYPNSVQTVFLLGSVSFMAKDYDSAAQYFTAATKLRPDAWQPFCNLGATLIFQKKVPQGLAAMLHAAELGDSKSLAEDLLSAVAIAETDAPRDPNLPRAKQAANLLATKYQVRAPAREAFLIVGPPHPKEGQAGGDALSFLWSGSGFFISDDGLILTNAHVVRDSKTLMVIIGAKQTSAEVVKIDDEQDLALIRVAAKDKTPFIHLAKPDQPNDGADVVVMGYPLLDRLGADIKITRGVVSSNAAHEDIGADVMTDAKVNPGNSGGPILDHNGNAMAIISLKSRSSEMEDSYGMGISAGQIRKFLAKNNITAAPGNPAAAVLSTEQIVALDKPATVCILATK